MYLSDKFCYRKIGDKYLLVSVKKNNLSNSLIEINKTTADIISLAITGTNKSNIILTLIEKYHLTSEYFSILEQSIDDLINMEILVE